MSSQNIFNEIQDPKVLTRLRHAFIALALTGLLVAFVGSEGFRGVVIPFESGIDGNQPVQVDRSPSIDRDQHLTHTHGSKDGKLQPIKQSKGPDNPSIAPSPGSPIPQNPQNPGSGNENNNGSNDTGGGNPRSTPTNPSIPISGAPTTPGQQPGTVPRGPATPATPATPAQPKGPLSPIVSPVLETVNETVNGVTEKVNDTTDKLPVQTNLPEDLCLLKC